MNDATLDFIDAHHHFWDLQACHYPWLMATGEQRFFGDPTPIQKNYLAQDLLSESIRYRPRQSVHIQVGVAQEQALRETQWLQELPDYPHGIVAFCDLASADAQRQLTAQRACSRLRGIRQIIGRHAEEDRKHDSDALLANPDWARGLRLLADMGLSFDLQLIPPQMERAFELLRTLPELPVALCHLGSPWDQSPAGLAHWRAGLQRFAQLPNFYCKVSGLGMFNRQWQVAHLRPLILDAIEIFGPQRIMFGSNFPVDKLYRTYDQLWSAYEEITEPFTSVEKRRMFRGTAQQFYRL